MDGTTLDSGMFMMRKVQISICHQPRGEKIIHEFWQQSKELANGGMCPFVSVEVFEERLSLLTLASVAMHCLLTDDCFKNPT